MKTMISTTHMIAAAVIAGAFAIGFLSGPALADEPVNGATQFKFKFHFSPDELTSAPMAKKMLIRLERKVRDYCGDNRKTTHVQREFEREFVRACVSETMSSTITKFGSATVAEAYKSRAEG
jgi:UrcA family protein